MRIGSSGAGLKGESVIGEVREIREKKIKVDRSSERDGRSLENTRLRRLVEKWRL